MKWIFCGIVFLISSYLYCFDHEVLNQISLNEKMYIRWFAKGLIETDQISHVLFYENKAAAWGGCALKGRDKRLSDVQFAKGWRLFKKYEHLFPHPNYIIQASVTKDNSFLCGFRKILHIFVINKRTLEECLNQHVNVFKEVLGDHFDCGDFIAKLNEGVPLKELLEHDEMLLGILLGFGEESARKYKTIGEHHTGLFPPPWREDYCGIDVDRPAGCRISPVAFMGNPHSSEVQRLIKIYASELETFWDVYKNEDSLLLFLKGLTKE